MCRLTALFCKDGSAESLWCSHAFILMGLNLQTLSLYLNESWFYLFIMAVLWIVVSASHMQGKCYTVDLPPQSQNLLLFLSIGRGRCWAIPGGPLGLFLALCSEVNPWVLRGQYIVTWSELGFPICKTSSIPTHSSSASHCSESFKLLECLWGIHLIVMS